MSLSELLNKQKRIIQSLKDIEKEVNDVTLQISNIIENSVRKFMDNFINDLSEDIKILQHDLYCKFEKKYSDIDFDTFIKLVKTYDCVRIKRKKKKSDGSFVDYFIIEAQTSSDDESSDDESSNDDEPKKNKDKLQTFFRHGVIPEIL